MWLFFGKIWLNSTFDLWSHCLNLILKGILVRSVSGYQMHVFFLTSNVNCGTIYLFVDDQILPKIARKRVHWRSKCETHFRTKLTFLTLKKVIQ